MASVVVKITSDASAFSESIDRARADVKRLAAEAGKPGGGFLAGAAEGAKGVTVEVSGLRENVSWLWKGLARAAAGADLGETVAELEELGGQSRALGVTTDALSRLHYAAQMTDVAPAEMNAALQNLSINAVRAAGGSTKLSAAFAALGIDARRFAALSPDQQFVKVAAAMERTGSQAQRLAAARALMGEGQGAARVASLGSAGVAELSRQSDAAGYTVSPQTVAVAEEAADALKHLEVSMTVLKRTLAVGAAPAMRAIAGLLRLVVSAAAALDVGTMKAAGAVLSFGSALAVVVRWGPAVVASLAAVGKAVKALATSTAMAQALSGPKGWLALAGGAVLAAASYYGVSTAMDAIATSAAEAAEETRSLGAAADAGGQTLLARLAEQAAAASQSARDREIDDARRQLPPQQWEEATRLIHLRYNQEELAAERTDAARRIAELRDQLAAARSTPRQRELAAAEKLPAEFRGEAVDLVRRRQALEDEARATEEQKKRLEELRQAAKQYATPLERAKEQIAELNTMLTAKIITPAQFERYAGQVAAGYSSGRKAPTDGPRSLDVGGREEYQLRLRAERENLLRQNGLSDNLQKQQLRTQIDQLKTQRDIARRMPANVDAIEPAPL